MIQDTTRPQALDEKFIKKLQEVHMPDSTGCAYVLLSQYGITHKVNAVYDFKNHMLRDNVVPHFSRETKISVPDICTKEDAGLYRAAYAEVCVNGADGLKNLNCKLNAHQLAVVEMAFANAKEIYLKNQPIKPNCSLSARPEEYSQQARDEMEKRGNEILRNHGIEID